MNNEIKEILEIFKQVDLDREVGGCYNCPKKDKDKTCIGCLNNAKDKLLDYITNLQQENKYLDELRNANYLSWQDSLSRIEKAINKVQDIIDIGFDYDGYNDVDNLKTLVDELVDLARQTKNILNGGSDK